MSVRNSGIGINNTFSMGSTPWKTSERICGPGHERALDKNYMNAQPNATNRGTAIFGSCCFVVVVNSIIPLS